MFTLDLPTILQSLRPGEKWCVRGDQKSYGSLEWMDSTAAPTEQELLDAELAAAKAARTATIKTEAASRILAAHPAWKQTNAALGLDDVLVVDALKAGITAIRAASNTAEADVAALTAVADVVAFTW